MIFGQLAIVYKHTSSVDLVDHTLKKKNWKLWSSTLICAVQSMSSVQFKAYDMLGVKDELTEEKTNNRLCWGGEGIYYEVEMRDEW